MGDMGLKLALDLQSSVPHKQLEQEAEAPGGHVLCCALSSCPTHSRALQKKGSGQAFAPMLALGLFHLAQSMQPP